MGALALDFDWVLLVCIVCLVLVLLSIGTVGCELCIKVPNWIVLSLEVVLVYGNCYQCVNFFISKILVSFHFYFDFLLLVWSYILKKNCQVKFFSSPPPRVLLHIDVRKYNNV